MYSKEGTLTSKRVFSTGYTLKGDSEEEIVKQVSFAPDRDIELEAASTKNASVQIVHEIRDSEERI